MDEIGQKLREARLEKGYTIDDLQQITKIQKRYLIAIEEGNFDALPGDFYVRAFIKQYASVVGMNPDKLVEDYQQDIPTVQPTPVAPQEEEQPTRSAHHSERAAKAGKSMKRFLPQILVGVAVVAIFGVVYGLTISQQRKDTKPSIPVDQSSVSVEDDTSSKKSSSKAESKQAESDEPAAESSSAAKPEKKKTKKTDKKKSDGDLTISEPAGTDTAQTFTVKGLKEDGNAMTLKATDADAWMSVTVDGVTTWQGVVAAGAEQKVDIPATAKSVAVKSGNAKANDILINDDKVDLGDATTLVRTMTFTIEQ